MNNFDYCVSTRVVFGRDAHRQVGKLIKEYGFHKILIHYGGESAKRSGLLEQVMKDCHAQGIEYVLLGGVTPNPCLLYTSPSPRDS